MVCKTPPTIHLLEVGDTAKKKYYEQSQKTEMPFLLNAIDMANDCDLKYRSSRNQRLLIELCLMQLASITFDGEKKKKPAPTAVPTVTKEQPQEQETHTSLSTQETSSSATPPKEPQTTETPRLDVSKERVSGLSIKGLRKKKELQEKLANKKIDHTNLPTEAFTEAAMQTAWQEYVQLLIEKGERIVASNLEADTPTLDGVKIKLQFPNETMKVEVERAQGPLLDYLKRTLNNYDIILDITVNEEIVRKYAYTPQEKYDKLKEHNPNIEILRKAFDLEL